MNQFKTLSPEDQQKIFNLCNKHTYDQVVEVLAKPAPEGFNITTSPSALCRFVANYDPEMQQARAIQQFAKQLRVRRAAGPTVILSGILASVENRILDALRRGMALADMSREFRELAIVHKCYLAEEKDLRDYIGKLGIQKDYVSYLQKVVMTPEPDFIRNDIPDDPGAEGADRSDFEEDCTEEQNLETAVAYNMEHRPGRDHSVDNLLRILNGAAPSSGANGTFQPATTPVTADCRSAGVVQPARASQTAAAPGSTLPQPAGIAENFPSKSPVFPQIPSNFAPPNPSASCPSPCPQLPANPRLSHQSAQLGPGQPQNRPPLM